MRIAYLDLAGGLSGDIFLAACIDAGVDPAELVGILKKLNLPAWEMEVGHAHLHGLNPKTVDFKTDPHPPHRTYGLIRDKIIGPAELPERTKSLALAAFQELARAEAKAHGVAVEEVHFHEVGADDSILDMVGGAACLELLKIDRLIASPIPVARGIGRSQHGRIPLPAPATVELLKGKPVYGAGHRKELVTPTGASILGWAEGFGELPGMELLAVGSGVGTRRDGPGLTRLFLGRTEESGAVGHLHRVAVLTTQIDDMNPELFGPLMEGLLAAGALDVVFSPVQMKKNRPGTRLEVMADPAQIHELAELVLEQTTTIGLRIRTEDRLCLERRAGQVTINGIEVLGKLARRPSGRWEFRPELDSCRAAAESLGLTVGRVFDLALAEGQKLN